MLSFLFIQVNHCKLFQLREISRGYVVILFVKRSTLIHDTKATIKEMEARPGRPPKVLPDGGRICNVSGSINFTSIDLFICLNNCRSFHH